MKTSTRRKHYGKECRMSLTDVTKDLPFKAATLDGDHVKIVIASVIAEELVAACRDAAERSTYTPMRMDTYNCRNIGGTSIPSVHSWSMAFDAFSTPVDVWPTGGVWTPDEHFDGATTNLEREFSAWASAFTDRGWTHGANFRRKSGRKPAGQTRGPAGMDTPHFEWSKLPSEIGGAIRNRADLKVGSRGQSVAVLQTVLAELYTADPALFPDPGSVDGQFGVLTFAAVKAYQTVLAIPPTGVWDEASAIANAKFREGFLVADVFSDELGRSPDVDGEAYWREKIKSLGVARVRELIDGSPEGIAFDTQPQASAPTAVAAVTVPVAAGPASKLSDEQLGRLREIQEIIAIVVTPGGQ